MPEYLPTTPYRGTRDFLPPEMSVRTQVYERLYGVLESRGFQRYDGPVLEPIEIYEAKSSREIVEQQLYTLTDRGGRRLALRPEMTPSVARIIAGNAGKLQFPVRWYSNPNCHRYERPQRGRVREHWQINADIFGSESPSCEIEIFELIHDMLGGIGATPDMWRLRVSDRVLLSSILTDIVELDESLLRGVSSIVDRWEKYPREKLAEDAGALGVTDKQFDRLAETLAGGAAVLDEIPSAVRENSQLAKVLVTDAAGLVEFDPMIVRGFDYYTSTVFEVFDTSPENNRSLFGGGRYDNLVGLYSAQKIPGIGFGMGDVTLIDFLGTHGLLPEPLAEVDVVVIPVEADLADPARSVARSLRAAGLRTSTPLEPRKLGKEITRADKAGARVVVIVGREDWDGGSVTIRNLVTKQQDQVSVDSVGAAVRASLDQAAEDVTGAGGAPSS
ncbi:histidyl-tRNA synthetase [Herbihabitans rhizosphaerae]|uniref:Histidine--tRNA ligase n=1 Tax=Herbihabitans rhizosphaerae TaxID=1872711 RepID=A0A4Q7KN41_9PSEU|nr:histidine--tRNA ligase [Herbihabitans rhizosphaerae]RZS37041.1 histidyl-tRNA synthetase [Herbihabitans rhizosphaerae]